MLEFIENNWTEILSVVGALAWIPIIFTPVVNVFRKVQVTLLDSRILTKATAIAAISKGHKSGTILMMALDFYINKITIFAKNISAIIVLKNGTKLKTELLDFSTLTSDNGDGTVSAFHVPMEHEMNVSRTICGCSDNIKYISFLVESGAFNSIDEIKEIDIYLSGFCKLFSKKVVIKNSDFPRFNTSHLLEQFEEVKRIEV